MSDGLVQILDGNTFVVSDSNGDIEASLTDPTGLFSFDTRFLSRWVLTVNGQRLNALSVDDLQYFETRSSSCREPGTVYIDAKLSVIRRRAVGDGFHEELTDPQPRRQAGRPRRPHRGRFGLRRPLRGQGRAREEGEVLDPRRARTPRCSATSARRSGARPRSQRRLRRASTRSGLTFRARIEPHGELDHRPERRHHRGCGRLVRPAEVRARSETGAAEHGAEPGEVARRGTAARMRPGRAQSDLHGAASSTSPRCASRRPSPGERACLPPACRGS